VRRRFVQSVRSGDDTYRFKQELVLGIGRARMVHALLERISGADGRTI